MPQQVHCDAEADCKRRPPPTEQQSCRHFRCALARTTAGNDRRRGAIGARRRRQRRRRRGVAPPGSLPSYTRRLHPLPLGLLLTYPTGVHTLSHLRANAGTPTPAAIHRGEAGRTMRAALAPYVRRSAAQRARGSAATDSPSASAASCATESCTATERRCATNVRLSGKSADGFVLTCVV